MNSKALKHIEKCEYDKYARLHAQNYGSTGYQQHISQYIHWTSDSSDKILDMGCGRGVAVKRLLLEYRDVKGVDITLMGCGLEFLPRGIVVPVQVDATRFIEAPLWALPFADNEFDYTFSADVMEHIPPELVEDAITEIYRVTSKRTLHVIATAPSTCKKGLHLTVKPMDWWRREFEQHNIGAIDSIIADVGEFMALYKAKAKEMSIVVKCTCDRLFDNKAKLVRHLGIHKGNARHVPDLCHVNTRLMFR